MNQVSAKNAHTPRKIYYFYYADIADTEAIIRLRATRKPSVNTVPANGTWIVQELSKEFNWVMPCFPEITWSRLKKMYLIKKELVCLIKT